ncbi:MAG: hypothetical protein ACI9TH_000684 [Kiritimatiellia bacterium]|jgi:hypothetical protein
MKVFQVPFAGIYRILLLFVTVCATALAALVLRHFAQALLFY